MIVFGTAFLVKIVATALFVLIIVSAAERFGPFWGGLIGALPTSIGPAYVILAIDSNKDFVASSALESAAAGGATAVFAAVMTVLSKRRFHPLVVLFGAWSAWILAAFAIRAVSWSPVTELLENAVVFAVCMRVTYIVLKTPVEMPQVRRRGYDLLVRPLVVGLFVAGVTTISAMVGSTGTGLIAMFPIVYSTLAVIMVTRFGHAVTAAMFASSLRPMLSLPVAFTVIHMTAAQWGSALSLSLGLAICVAWAAILIVWRHMRVPATRL